MAPGAFDPSTTTTATNPQDTACGVGVVVRSPLYDNDHRHADDGAPGISPWLTLYDNVGGLVTPLWYAITSVHSSRS